MLTTLWVITDSVTGTIVDSTPDHDQAFRIQDALQHERHEDGTFHAHHVSELVSIS